MARLETILDEMAGVFGLFGMVDNRLRNVCAEALVVRWSIAVRKQKERKDKPNMAWVVHSLEGEASPLGAFRRLFLELDLSSPPARSKRKQYLECSSDRRRIPKEPVNWKFQVRSAWNQISISS